MSNFEKIDEYLTNRLSEQDRKGFEQQLGADSALKAEVEFQTQIIEGLKKARVAELKAMLSKVPIEGGSVTEFPTLKVAAGLIGTAIIVSAGYLYYSNNNKAEQPVITTPIEDSIVRSEEAQPNDSEDNKDIIEQPKEPETTTQQQAQPSKVVPSSRPSDKEEASQPVDKPALDVIDPSEELTESTPTRGNSNTKPVLTIPKMNVEVDSSSKKYPFHYQFTDGKMILFGSFDKSLYEIIEINGESHSVFLYHKENYYKLDESKKEITPLEPVKDKALIQKLKEYRKK